MGTQIKITDGQALDEKELAEFIKENGQLIYELTEARISNVKLDKKIKRFEENCCSNCADLLKGE